MDNKKIGIVLILITLSIASILVALTDGLKNEAEGLGCYDNKDCLRLESNINITHLAFGIMGTLLGLGLYMLFFSGGEKAILDRLKEDRENIIKKEKFEIIMNVLDQYEKKVISIIKEQDGITQNTLRIRSDLSKAKLSYVLKELEKRNLIRRVEKGKTLAVHMNI